MKILNLFEIICAAVIMVLLLFAVAMLPMPTACEQRSAIEIPRCR
ncbi:hypothetical protein [Campylobacter magnus]|nr:hypothetical protein [Campylobacter magnus]MDD0855702.1 hypothetical protein [Campylobacter magnus]